MDYESYMNRCFDLALLGSGMVSPNPMVGAVLVHNDRIIGEGWHQRYGHAHAEVNAVNSVRPEDRALLSQSTFFVSLEPCCIHGNTPPCTDLIIKHKIPKVVISAVDQTPGVQGGGVDILRNSGVEVITGILEEKGREISAFRNTYVSKKRPYVLIKFARSKDGYLGKTDRQVWISNAYSKRMSHKLRFVYDAILIGTNTAITDRPQLTNRWWYGNSPLRVVIDRSLKIPLSSPLFEQASPVWIIANEEPVADYPEHVSIYKMEFNEELLDNIMSLLYEKRITSMIVEGGAFTVKEFVRKGFWDEVWEITGDGYLGNGVTAPAISGEIISEIPIQNNTLTVYRNE